VHALVKLLGGVRASVFAAVALVALAAAGIQSWRLSGAEAELVALDQRAKAEAAVAAENLRLKTAEIKALQAKFKEIEDEAQAERDRLLADLADGRRRLRERFQCPAAPAPAGAAGGGDGAGQGGLLAADGEFLVRFAAECDAVARRLTLAQDYIESIQR